MGFQFVRHQWRRLHHQGRDDRHCVGHLRDDGPILRTDGRRKHHQRTRGKSISREFYSIFVYTKHCSVLRGTKQFYLIQYYAVSIYMYILCFIEIEIVYIIIFYMNEI